MESISKGFLSIPHRVGDVLPYLDLTERQWRIVWLIIRLTYGCQRHWVKLKLCDFAVVRISSYHIRKVINPLLNKEIILNNSHKKEYRINEEYLATEFTELVSFELERLAKLIGRNLRNKTYQNGKEKLTKSVNEDLPKGEISTYQTGKKANHGSASLKDIIKNKSKNSDKYKEIADIKISYKTNGKDRDINPNYFSPITEGEYTAKDIWSKLEPDNPDSFNFYLYASKKLPRGLLYQFMSEIQHDKSVKNKGAVFVNKVQAYLKEKGS